MIQLQLTPEIEAELEQEALAKGLALTVYIASIVLERPGKKPVHDVEAIDRAIATMREIRERSHPGPESMKDLINEGRRY